MKQEEIEEEEILIADCAKDFIRYCADLDWQGSQCCAECDMQEYGITSPPEQLWYAAALYVQLQDWATIHPQYPIAGFQVDFMIDPLGYFSNHPFNLFGDSVLAMLGTTMTKFVVEIDGFEWHDKTPAQAEHDKRRERLIQQQGYRLFRYAAREVLRDPFVCARDMRVLVHAELKKACATLTLQQTVHVTRQHPPFEGLGFSE